MQAYRPLGFNRVEDISEEEEEEEDDDDEDDEEVEDEEEVEDDEELVDEGIETGAAPQRVYAYNNRRPGEDGDEEDNGEAGNMADEEQY